MFNFLEKHVTLTSLNNELKNKEIVSISNPSLSKILKELGFKYRKDDNRRSLMERTNIASQRACFLRKYRENRYSASPREVIFLDETWIYAKGTKINTWQDSNVKSVRKPQGYDGKRFIIVHAGSSKGFVEGASLLFSSKSLTMDYHGEMNGNIFTQWITTQLIPNLEEPSLIIMDNAPYHSMLVEKQPSHCSRRDDIIIWLKANKINFSEALTRPELLQLAKMNRKANVYIIDELLREHGHEVLRLAPYHCDFNAIELIWANCKSYYNKSIGRDGYGDDKVLSMWRESLENCNVEVWQECVRHTEKLIEDWYIRERNLN
uniref:Uncharacterized protein LOC114338511 n=1 Tax=Diabrotica virgifera virgifera TaxID=50390 RepID=A0A6P7G776_DIAVI